MNYETVTLQEKTVAGVSARTSNHAEDMSAVIGGLWNTFFEKGVYSSIPNKASHTTLGVYSNYDTDHHGSYDITVCCEVTSCENLPAEITVHTIPAGKYAKFIVKGDPVQDVANFWSSLWDMPLDRAFQYDFEEYVSGGAEGPCEIHIYISLN